MKRTLFEISEDMAALEAVLEECGGDISSPNAEAALNAWEAELASDLERKVDGYCAVIAEIEARIAAREEEAARLRNLAKIDANVVEAMRDRLLMVWEARDLGTVQTPRFRVSRARLGGAAPLVIDGEVPERFTRTTVEPDRTKIREAILSGEELPFARLAERGARIVIK